MKTSWSFIPAGIVAVALIVACSGASTSDILSPDPDGSNGSRDGGARDGAGDDCPPCEAAPDPSCIGTGRCGCGPYVCPDAGSPGSDCVWSANDNPCGPGLYCSTKNCGKGTCAPIAATESNAKEPVCGCDGVTYWNETVAAKHSMSTRKNGVCESPHTCGGFIGRDCPNNAKCNYQVEGINGCSVADQSGTCWMLPEACPRADAEQTGRACGSSSCEDECSLIEKSGPWYEAGACFR